MIGKKDEENDPISDQRKYMLFKSIYRVDNYNLNYDPSSRMISESIIHVIVTTLKQMMVQTQKKIRMMGINDSIPIFLPTVLIINELASNMMINEHFKTILFGIHNKSKRKFDEAKLISLAQTLANKTLNDFIHQNDSFRDYDETHNGVNMYCALAGCSYDTRYRVWLDKLKNLLLKSNEHWLLNQFQFCKILIFNNSFEMNVDNIPEYMFDVIPYLANYKQNCTAQNNKKNKNIQNEWNDNDKVDKLNIEKKLSPIKMLNIPSFIGFFIGNEQRINKIYQDSTNSSNLKQIQAGKELMARRENQAIMKITSSNIGMTYEALNKLTNS